MLALLLFFNDLQRSLPAAVRPLRAIFLQHEFQQKHDALQ